jgi:hypothetical protein
MYVDDPLLFSLAHSKQGNLIYLALITERIPIIAKFTPSHVDNSAPPFAFGDVIDIPRLSQAIGSPVIEWHEVKDPKSDVLDDIGCWSVWESVQKLNPNPRGSPSLNWLRLGEKIGRPLSSW